MKQKLRANTLHDLPSDIYNALKRARKAANALENISAKHGLTRKFSIDGRFLGDIGELLVHQHFDVILAEKQKLDPMDIWPMARMWKLSFAA